MEPKKYNPSLDNINNIESVEGSQNIPEKENNTHEKLNEEIEAILKKIEEALGKTTIMVFRVWITHPEMFSELKDLREKFEENKQSKSRESTSNILRKIRELFDKYWNDKEKNIMNDLGECLYKLQQTRSELNKMKNLGGIVRSIDDKFGKNMESFVSSIDMIKWTDMPEWTGANPKKLTTGNVFKYPET